MAGNQQGTVATVVVDINIRLAAEMIGRRCYKSQIKEYFEKEFGGPIAPKTFETIMGRARELLRSRRDIELTENLDQSIEFYSSIIRDESKPPQYRIRCQERLDLLLGLEGQSGGLSSQEKVAEALKILHGSNAGVLSSDDI